jgi:AcrR family transcriptional regulator
MEPVAKATPERREDALSRERIVDAAIELLDAEGDGGLTFRALAARLATGPGAIYWHVSNKSELLDAASVVVVARALGELVAFATPHEAIRRIAVGVFEAIDAHPWMGVQLSLAPWTIAMLQIFERIGRQVQALGVPDAALFTSASALVSYVVGASTQNAANGRLLEPSANRDEFLATEAARWKELDAHEYPFTRDVAAHVRKHDDRDEFLAGVDLILAGIAASTDRAISRRRPSHAKPVRRTKRKT